MAVVNLEEAVATHLHQVFGGDGPIKIRVIDVRKDSFAVRFPLRQNRVDVLLHDVENAVAGEGGNELANIHRADVDRYFPVICADLLSHHQEKVVGFFEAAAEFIERFQADHLRAFNGPLFHPLIGKTLQVFFSREDRRDIGCDGRPLLAFLSNVVVGEDQEMVAMIFVPIDDHLRVVVAIAPERMGVEITFPPGHRFCGDCRQGNGQNRRNQKE